MLPPILRLLLAASLLPLLAQGAAPESLDSFLRSGRLKEGLAAYAEPVDDAGRFSKAMLQSLAGLQRFSAGLKDLNLRDTPARQVIPFLRMVPVTNPAEAAGPGQPATPERVRALFTGLRADLRAANASLAGLTGAEFQVEVNLSRVAIDFDGNGVVAPGERLLDGVAGLLRIRPADPEAGEVVVRFDAADAIWLQGYTHLLPGTLDVLLAYDWMPVWNQYAHRLFLRPEPVPALAGKLASRPPMGEYADIIAAIHDMRLPVSDREGLRRARDEFRAMIATSRLCWARVLAETDDDHEWLPSPRQTGPGGARVTQAQVDGWSAVLDEFEAVASGKRLLPHWRFPERTGINLDRLVADPPPFDLVLMAQGSAFIPYMETGEVSDRARWNDLLRAFESGFLLFAVWSN